MFGKRSERNKNNNVRLKDKILGGGMKKCRNIDTKDPNWSMKSPEDQDILMRNFNEKTAIEERARKMKTAIRLFHKTYNGGDSSRGRTFRELLRKILHHRDSAKCGIRGGDESVRSETGQNKRE